MRSSIRGDVCFSLALFSISAAATLSNVFRLSSIIKINRYLGSCICMCIVDSWCLQFPFFRSKYKIRSRLYVGISISKQRRNRNIDLVLSFSSLHRVFWLVNIKRWSSWHRPSRHFLSQLTVAWRRRRFNVRNGNREIWRLPSQLLIIQKCDTINANSQTHTYSRHVLAVIEWWMRRYLLVNICDYD